MSFVNGVEYKAPEKWSFEPHRRHNWSIEHVSNQVALSLVSLKSQDNNCYLTFRRWCDNPYVAELFMEECPREMIVSLFGPNIPEQDMSDYTVYYKVAYDGIQYLPFDLNMTNSDQSFVTVCLMNAQYEVLQKGLPDPVVKD